jgi:DNA invertase Pin-like site-specific DNA recombinase
VTREAEAARLAAALEPCGVRLRAALAAARQEQEQMRPAIARMYDLGVPVAEIVKVSGVSRQGVYNIAKAAGLPVQRGARNQHTQPDTKGA